MALAKIKKGDTVVVLAGKDKGKSGEVTAGSKHRCISRTWRLPTRSRARQRVFA